ncbi:GNAT family N-acetyltransferase [Algicella marina]|uniref:GNAT family N-acetyltransferase n=1 Tax=Algicella marina TaxID=2683284 RepID=A0A6P1SXL0_9RHOB|nr:GNAT family N-acetyltransferase [Algicella marina]QHQ33946.1 GNAT family N-acetyltransferase [Algicella marina]
MTLAVRPLNAETWNGFAELVEAHGGIWGGCWCLAFHFRGKAAQGIGDKRAKKEAMVRTGETHAALVFDGGECAGWAQYGCPAELPAIQNRKAYEEGLAALPDSRITCLFVGKAYRKRGVADLAVRGALEQIGEAGGGSVEAFPEETEGRKVSGAFLWGGTLGMYERLGFVRERKIGKHKWVVRRGVAAGERLT